MPAALQAAAVGPVDVAVIVFPDSAFNGEVAPALLELHQNGTIRLLDVAFVAKDVDGAVASLELTDERMAAAYGALTGGEQYELLSEDDLGAIGEGLDAGSAALVLVWENAWASRVASAVRDSGGELTALQRIPHEVVAAAIAALDEEE